METPAYVSIVFILTTFTTVGFFLRGVKSAGLHTFPAKILLFLLPLWILFQSVLATGGFYQKTEFLPPRLLIFGVVPALALIAIFLLFFRSSFIEHLPIRLLTLVHVVRFPVEIVLYWLYHEQLVPREMTFLGWNYDILSGPFAILVFVTVFRNLPNPETSVSSSLHARVPDSAAKTFVLIAFNLVGIALLINIVTIAVLSLPSPLQRLAFDQPNRAILSFPYVFLPTVVVPIVLFSHLAVLYKTLRRNPK